MLLQTRRRRDALRHVSTRILRIFLERVPRWMIAMKTRKKKRKNCIDPSNYFPVCDPCVRPGHICDPDTGRCVCPTLTFGEHCDRCRPGSWDLVAGVGCRPCACTLGSTKPHCDHRGQCPCRIGYAGLRCERCAKGYYGYPRCRPCGCNVAGTTRCDHETCDCDDEGQCPCKVHRFWKKEIDWLRDDRVIGGVGKIFSSSPFG